MSRECTSLVLLNSEGVVVSELQLVSLSSDYVVPEGMTVRWRTELHLASSRDPLAGLFGPKEPVEAFFYLGKAQGQVCRFKQYELDDRFGPIRYGSQVLTVTVYGTSAKDVMELRNHIMHIIHFRACWNVSNDLNPKPKTEFLHWLKKVVGMAK